MTLTTRLVRLPQQPGHRYHPGALPDRPIDFRDDNRGNTVLTGARVWAERIDSGGRYRLGAPAAGPRRSNQYHHDLYARRRIGRTSAGTGGFGIDGGGEHRRLRLFLRSPALHLPGCAAELLPDLRDHADRRADHRQPDDRGACSDSGSGDARAPHGRTVCHGARVGHCPGHRSHDRNRDTPHRGSVALLRTRTSMRRRCTDHGTGCGRRRPRAAAFKPQIAQWVAARRERAGIGAAEFAIGAGQLPAAAGLSSHASESSWSRSSRPPHRCRSSSSDCSKRWPISSPWRSSACA